MIQPRLREAVEESNLIEGVPNEGLCLSNHLRAARLCELAASFAEMVDPRLLHAVVFEGLSLPGDHQPGEYRRIGVRVGQYIAPSFDRVPGLMEGWRDFFEEVAETTWPLHAMFEAIHPFPDGNGRVGRLVYWNAQMCCNQDIEIIWAHNRLDYYERLEAWRTQSAGWWAKVVERAAELESRDR